MYQKVHSTCKVVLFDNSKLFFFLRCWCRRRRDSLGRLPIHFPPPTRNSETWQHLPNWRGFMLAKYLSSGERDAASLSGSFPVPSIDLVWTAFCLRNFWTTCCNSFAVSWMSGISCASPSASASFFSSVEPCICAFVPDGLAPAEVSSSVVVLEPAVLDALVEDGVGSSLFHWVELSKNNTRTATSFSRGSWLPRINTNCIRPTS